MSRFLISLFLVFACGLAFARPQEPYNPQNAVNYAHTWVQNGGTPLRNPAYPDYSANSSDGGDCTNFVSQALRAGGWRNTTLGSANSDLYWYYVKPTQVSLTWTTANGFFRRMNGGLPASSFQNFGPSYESWFGWSGNASGITANYGDVIFADFTGNGSIDHTMLVTGFYRRTDQLVEVRLSYHTTDREDYPISNITAAYPNIKLYRFGKNYQSEVPNPSYIW